MRVQPVANARAYEARYKSGGDWLPAGVFTNSRRIEIGNLTPGTAYGVFYLRPAPEMGASVSPPRRQVNRKPKVCGWHSQLGTSMTGASSCSVASMTAFTVPSSSACV